jgi:peptidoglycan/LPS O-acetylase OafA/YrhL
VDSTTLHDDVLPPTGAAGAALQYMPQLDALRALAVLAVWCAHWGIEYQRYFKWIEWGHYGVWLFFVLSGFLITDILLKSKLELDSSRQEIWPSAKIFYIRRFLRILPAYYLTLFVAAVFVHDVRHLFPWHVTYTTDFWSALHYDRWLSIHPGGELYGIHFWTLGVEEQFYLVWPWVILLTPRRLLGRVAWSAALLGIAYRALFQGGLLGSSHIAALGLPIIGNIDKFAWGALLAIYWTLHGSQSIQSRRLSQVGLWIGVPAMVIIEAIYARNPHSTVVAMFSSAAAGMGFMWLIGRAAHGFKGPVGAALQSPVLVYPGKISYGLYLYHPFVPLLLVKLHVHFTHSVWLNFIIFGSATIFVASGSWYLFERPINGLKRFFPYNRTPRPASAPVAYAPG